MFSHDPDVKKFVEDLRYLLLKGIKWNSHDPDVKKFVEDLREEIIQVIPLIYDISCIILEYLIQI